jgi:hypothetical protein
MLWELKKFAHLKKELKKLIKILNLMINYIIFTILYIFQDIESVKVFFKVFIIDDRKWYNIFNGILVKNNNWCHWQFESVL